MLLMVVEGEKYFCSTKIWNKKFFTTIESESERENIEGLYRNTIHRYFFLIQRTFCDCTVEIMISVRERGSGGMEYFSYNIGNKNKNNNNNIDIIGWYTHLHGHLRYSMPFWFTFICACTFVYLISNISNNTETPWSGGVSIRVYTIYIWII